VSARKRPDASALLADMAPSTATLDAIEKAPKAPEAAELVPLERIKPSPYQPEGRPSSEAIEKVSAAIAAAGGSLSELMELPDPRLTELLGPRDGPQAEARQLAELAFDIQAARLEGRGIGGSGIDTALEARMVQPDPVGRTVELLSGHRRMAAARIGGSQMVPVLNRGTLSEDEAATAVVRRNLHRADLTPWQEARILANVVKRRQEAGHPTTVRDLARLMGYSIGRVSTLQRAARTFLPVLHDLGNGDPATAEARLARLTYTQLEALAGIEDAPARMAQTRSVAGLAAPEMPDPGSDAPMGASVAEGVKTAPSAISEAQPVRPAVERVRGGGVRLTGDDFALTITRPLGPDELRALGKQIAATLNREATRLEREAKRAG
jgi:ParB family chromosome partitioning protein